MTSEVNQGRTEDRSLGRLRAAALIAVLMGAVGSVGLTLSAGRGRNEDVLVSLMVGWVFAPWAGLALAHVLAKRWLLRTRVTLYWLMLALTLGALAAYVGDTIRNAGSQDAFVFVLVPLVSWVLIVLVLSIAAFAARRASRRDEGA